MANKKPIKANMTELGEVTKNVGEITAKMTLDVADALTGLKAVQKEARKTTQALREIEEAGRSVHLNKDGLCIYNHRKNDATRYVKLFTRGGVTYTEWGTRESTADEWAREVRPCCEVRDEFKGEN